MTVSAEIRDGRILAVVPWDGGRGKTLAKSIPGYLAVWDKQPGQRDKFVGWSYPLSWGTCAYLRRVFGRQLQIGPELTAWAWDERRRQEHLETLRAGVGADLPRVKADAPALWDALQNRPFQIAGTAFCANGRRVCLGDEPRLGKTYQALGAVIEAGCQTILIACPKTATRSVWAAKIRELLGEEAFVAQEVRSNRMQVLAQFTEATGRRWLVVNKEMIRVRRLYECPDGTRNRIKPGRKNGCQSAHAHKAIHEPHFPQIHDIEYDAVILDECHHALASTKNMQSDGISQIRMGAVKLRVTNEGLKLALSGTPFRAALKKSWGVLNWLRPDIFRSYWQYAERHFGVGHDKYGYTVEQNDKPIDQALFDAELRPYYLARTKAEVAPQLPPIVYAGTAPRDNPDGEPGVYIDMLPEQEKAYRSIADDATAEIEGGRLLANGVLAELVRLRQFASTSGRMSQGKFTPALQSNKFDWIVEFLEERRSRQGKVVIATGFTQLANLFAKELRALGWETLLLTGETTSRQRDHAQDEFQHGSARIIVINMFAGGEAIDLSAADEMIFVDEPWTDDIRQQAENRIQNLAKRQQLTVYRLRSEGTVEEWIASLNAEQRAILMSAKPKALEMLKKAMAK
jgi:Zierdtviridae DNA helicase